MCGWVCVCVCVCVSLSLSVSLSLAFRSRSRLVTRSVLNIGLGQYCEPPVFVFVERQVHSGLLTLMAQHGLDTV